MDKLVLETKAPFVILLAQIFKPGAILIIQARKYVLPLMDLLVSHFLIDGI